MAASEKQLRSLKEEATCSICLEYFTEPVSVECGHVFCLSCITKCWEGLQTNFPCPQCRETSKNKTFRPNRQLANMVEIAKELHTPRATPEEENLCREHEEKLKLFCQDDRKPICVVCSMSRDHKPHNVLPIGEAAQEYKKILDSHSKRLLKELEDLQKCTAEERSAASELEGKLKNETEKIIIIFEQLKQFLEKEKQQLLKQLEKEQEEKMKNIHKKVAELENQLSTHNDLIAEIKEKCKQEHVQLLKDVQQILSRCDELDVLKLEEDAKVERTLPSAKHHARLQDKLTELKETFPAELEFQREIKLFEREVTLDLNTAHNWLNISEDGRSVRRGDRAQDRPDTAERFSKYSIVLGRERLTSGRHYWEVEVGDKTDWTLGLCDEFVSRKGEFTLSPEDGLWTVFLRDGKYKACTVHSILLMPSTPPRVIGLFLDYEAGRLSVYNGLDRSLLFTFSEATFPCTLRPFFCPGLKDGEKNLGALQILRVSRKN